MLPSRSTFVFSLASSASFKAAAFFCCLFSLMDETPLERMMAITIPTGSYQSASPMKNMTISTTSATKRIMIIGSLNPSIIFFQRDSGGICVRALLPFIFRLSSTSFSVNPLRSDILFFSFLIFDVRIMDVILQKLVRTGKSPSEREGDPVESIISLSVQHRLRSTDPFH